LPNGYRIPGTAHAASKGAVATFTTGFAKELARESLRWTRGRVDLLTYGARPTCAIQPFRIGSELQPLPVETSNISSRYGEPPGYAGIDVRFFPNVVQGWMNMPRHIGSDTAWRDDGIFDEENRLAGAWPRLNEDRAH
jgi:hypothetical protein